MFNMNQFENNVPQNYFHSSKKVFYQLSPNLQYCSKNENHDQFSFKLTQSIGNQIFQTSPHSILQASRHSISSNKSVDNTLTLRQNLIHLQKQQIIDLLLEQIKSSPNFKSESDEKKIHLLFRRSCDNKMEEEDHLKILKYKDKYDDLVKDFQEYIENTKQAEFHYLKIIQDLKKQKKTLQLLSSSSQSHKSKLLSNNFHMNLKKPQINQIDKSQSSHFQSLQIEEQQSSLAKKLQQTLFNCMQINNELASKGQKLQRQCKKLQQLNSDLRLKLNQLQCQNSQILSENDLLIEENSNFKKVVKELKDQILQVRALKNDTLDLQIAQLSGASEIHRLSDLIDYSQVIDKSLNQFSLRSLNKVQNSNEEDNFLSKSLIGNGSCNPQKISCLQSKDQQISQSKAECRPSQIIQIQNQELQLINLKLQQLLERKSEKIRTLLSEIEQLEEDKMRVKLELEELKKIGLRGKQNSQQNFVCKSQTINPLTSQILLFDKNQNAQQEKLINQSCSKSDHSSTEDTMKDIKNESLYSKFSFVQKKSASIIEDYQKCFKNSSKKPSSHQIFSTVNQIHSNADQILSTVKSKQKALVNEVKPLAQTNQSITQNDFHSLCKSLRIENKNETIGMIKRKVPLNFDVQGLQNQILEEFYPLNSNQMENKNLHD